MPRGPNAYPPDEFDNVDPLAPRGMHYAKRGWLQRAWPFLAVLILAPLAAYLLVNALSTGSLTLPGTTPPGGTTIESPTVSPTDDTVSPTEEEPDEEEPTGEPTDEETTEEPPPTVDPDLSTAVRVLNSTSTTGLAGQGQSRLQAAGWTTVSTGNYAGTLAESTVFYAEDDPVLEASAWQVAEDLGIATVELDAAEAGATITAVLAADFTP